MGIRSKVALLPAAVRSELDRHIVERAFGGYQSLAEWLQAKGHRISDDSVQRYGVRLRHQLDAISLACHQAQALAAPEKGIGHIADSLTAITVLQIQQQVLSILQQPAELHPSSGGVDIIVEAGPGDCTNRTCSADARNEAGEESGPTPPDGEAKIAGVPDLVRLRRISADLNRIMTPQRRGAEPLREQRERAANGAGSKPGGKALSDEACQSFQTILVARAAFPPLSSAAQPDSASSPREPAARSSAQIETPVNPAESLSDVPATAEGQPNPLEVQLNPLQVQPNPSEPTQPQLTAPDRTCPYKTADRTPLENVINCVWPALLFPKLVSFPRELAETSNAPIETTAGPAESI
jgi:hypothetical protein